MTTRVNGKNPFDLQRRERKSLPDPNHKYRPVFTEVEIYDMLQQWEKATLQIARLNGEQYAPLADLMLCVETFRERVEKAGY